MFHRIPIGTCINALILCICYVSSTDDVCKSIQDGILYPAIVIYRCLNTIPHNPKIANTTVESIKQWMEAYAFLDFYKAPTADLQLSQIDLLAQLECIGNASFSSDYQFQMTLWDLFRSLQDSHTLYLPPDIYQEFQYSLPFCFTTHITPSGDLAYFVAPNRITEAYLAQQTELLEFPDLPHDLPFISEQHIGLRIAAINGVDPTVFLLRMADELASTSKDIHARFNSIVSGGLWTVNAAVCLCFYSSIFFIQFLLTIHLLCPFILLYVILSTLFFSLSFFLR